MGFRQHSFIALSVALVMALVFLIDGAHAGRDRIDAEKVSWFLNTLGVSRFIAGNPGQDSSPVRSDAIYLLGLFEAVNSIERKYEPFMVPFASIPVSINIRNCNNVVTAAHTARLLLDWLFPTPTPALAFFHHEASTIHIDTVRERLTADELQQSLALAEFVASTIIANRSTDGWRASPSHTGPIVNGTKAGQYIYGTSYYKGFVFGSGYSIYVRPFGRQNCSNSLFSTAPPPAWGSAAYRADLEETFPFGASNPALNGNTNVTFTTALFHDGYFAAGTHIMHDFINSARHNLDDVDLLRALALGAISSNDAHGCHTLQKFQYNRARPVTDFHFINVTENPELAHLYDNSWTPPRATALNPEYPSGHSSRTSGTWSAMRIIFGDIPFSARGYSTPSLSRDYPSISAFIAEVNNARIFGGMHYRSSVEEATNYGERIATAYHQELLRPLRD